jgi:hypothetical protein
VIVCPLPFHPHHHNTPSFGILNGKDGYEHFKCFGACGKQGDVIDLVGYLNISGYNDKNPEHVRRAVSILTQRASVSFAAPQYQETCLPNNAWRKYPLGTKALEYAAKRGLTAETAHKFRLGQKGEEALMIPIFCDGLLHSLKFRRIKGSGMRYWSARGSKKALFNVDSLVGKEEPVLILKGEIAVMLLDQLGFNACCLTGGEGAKVEAWRHYLAFATRRVLVGDNDLNPETRRRMQAIARKRAEQWEAELRFPPAQYKDIDDWILKDSSAVDVIHSWYLG